MKTAPTNAATAEWALVPVEPTPEMRSAFLAAQWGDNDWNGRYAAMLAAVPTPSPDEWPEIWEDPAGKGYPCFRRPMTPAEAKATIDQYAARIVELEAALSSTDGLTREDGLSSFNVNEQVQVKLTEHGRAFHKARHLKRYPMLQYRAPDESRDGWSSWQLWVLMQEFGDAIVMGGPMPFETTIRLPLPSSPAEVG